MAFKQKSGYNPSFKMMGSSPLEQSREAKKNLKDVTKQLHQDAADYGTGPDDEPASQAFETLDNRYSTFNSNAGGTHHEHETKQDSLDYDYVVKGLSKIVGENYGESYYGEDTEQKLLKSHLDDGSGMTPVDRKYNPIKETPGLKQKSQSTNEFQQDSSLEKEMILAQGKVSTVGNSRYATPEQKAADLKIAQKGVDALSNQGYFRAKANHASSTEE